MEAAEATRQGEIIKHWDSIISAENSFCSAVERFNKGNMSLETVNVVANMSGKMLQLTKLQLEYEKAKGTNTKKDKKILLSFYAIRWGLRKGFKKRRECKITPEETKSIIDSARKKLDSLKDSLPRFRESGDNKERVTVDKLREGMAQSISKF